MAVQAVLLKAGSALVTGLVGAAAYEATKKALAKAPLRESAVAATALGLKGSRKAEEVAENARLNAADILAEAKERVGEESTPPATGAAHDHDH